MTPRELLGAYGPPTVARFRATVGATFVIPPDPDRATILFTANAASWTIFPTTTGNVEYDGVVVDNINGPFRVSLTTDGPLAGIGWTCVASGLPANLTVISWRMPTIKPPKGKPDGKTPKSKARP